MAPACAVLDYIYKFPEDELPAHVLQSNGKYTSAFYKMNEDDWEAFENYDFHPAPKLAWNVATELSTGMYKFFVVECWCTEGLCDSVRCRCGLVKTCKPHKVLVRVTLCEDWDTSSSSSSDPEDTEANDLALDLRDMINGDLADAEPDPTTDQIIDAYIKNNL